MARKGYCRLKRKDGTPGSWRIKIKDPGGGFLIRILAESTPEVEVRKIVAALRTDLEREAAGLPSLRKEKEVSQPVPTFGDWAKIWLEKQAVVKGWEANTIRSSVVALIRVMPWLESIRLDEISSNLFEKIQISLLGEGLAPQSVNRYIGKARLCLSDAQKESLISNVPKVKILKEKKTKLVRPPRVISEEDYKKGLKLAKGSVKLFITLLWHTGARVMEICEIRGEDLSGNKLVLGIHEKARKTGKRVIILSDEIAESLKERPLRTDGRYFQRDVIYYKQEWFKICDAAHIPRYSFKDFRTSWATRMRKAGAQLEVAAAYLGHSPEMLLNSYRKVTESDLEDLIPLLEKEERSPSGS